MQQAADSIDEKQLSRIETIIASMTTRKRRNVAIINGSSRKRIALGSGTSSRRSTASSTTIRCSLTLERAILTGY